MRTIRVRRALWVLVTTAALAALAISSIPATVMAQGDEVASVGSGEYHTCARKYNGTVWCWGYAADGQIGDGTTGDLGTRVTPAKVKQGSGSLTDIRAVTAGTGHSCGLKQNGTVWCWGDASYGQVGDGTTGDPVKHRRLTARKVKKGSGDLTHVTAIAAGAFHTCARREDGTVWCWGRASEGQLGDGTTGDPVTHTRLKAVKVRLGSHALTGITAIAAGDGRHTCALRGDRTVWCWGDASFGQVGDGTTGSPTLHIRTKAIQVRRGSGFLTDITAIAAGGGHSCARRSDGTVWCWGYNSSGQVGDGTTGDAVTHDRLKAVRVRRGSGYLSGVTRLGAGISHSCARRSDESAWCWGADEQGQVGDGTTGDPVTHTRLKAVRVVRAGGPLTKVRSIDGGVGHTCAVRSDRTVWCWGRNANGELGRGSADDDPHVHPVRVLFP